VIISVVLEIKTEDDRAKALEDAKFVAVSHLIPGFTVLSLNIWILLENRTRNLSIILQSLTSWKKEWRYFVLNSRAVKKEERLRCKASLMVGGPPTHNSEYIQQVIQCQYNGPRANAFNSSSRSSGS